MSAATAPKTSVDAIACPACRVAPNRLERLLVACIVGCCCCSCRLDLGCGIDAGHFIGQAGGLDTHRLTKYRVHTDRRNRDKGLNDHVLNHSLTALAVQAKAILFHGFLRFIRNMHALTTRRSYKDLLI
jgi:hypothetical protein